LLLQAKDVNGHTAEELLVAACPDSAAHIQRRLGLSGGRSIPQLEKLHLSLQDYERTDTSRSGAMQQVVAPAQVISEPWLSSSSNADGLLGGEQQLLEEEDADDEDVMSEVSSHSGAQVAGAYAGSKVMKASLQSNLDHSMNEDCFNGEEAVSHGISSCSAAVWQHGANDLIVTQVSCPHDTYCAEASMPFGKEIEYIHKCFLAVDERIVTWLDRASKENALLQPVPCPKNCGAMIKYEDLPTHIRDHCHLRKVQCSLCYQLVLFHALAEHERRHCMKRTIACPNSYQGCSIQITPEQAPIHLKTECEFRLVLCKQFCQMQIPHIYCSLHERDHCRNRIVYCDQCQGELQAHQYSDHLLEHCPYRKLKCSVGCGETFFAKDITAHEQNSCLRMCKHKGCNKRIGPWAKLSYHELCECDYRPVTCQYLCGACESTSLISKHKSYHEQVMCEDRPVRCSLGCGALVPHKALLAHRRDQCLERKIRCPSNFVGWKIAVSSDSSQTAKEGLVLKHQCKDVESAEEATSAHPKDELYVRFADGHEWIDAHQHSIVLLEKILKSEIAGNEDSLGCGWIIYSDLRSHQLFHCPYRKVYLSAQQHAVVTVQAVPFLQAAQSAVAIYETSKQNELLKDDCYQLACDYCGHTAVNQDAMQSHWTHDCSEYVMFCPIGCGDRVKRKHVDRHVAIECRKRVVECPNCRSSDLWAEELSEHMNMQCTHRVVPCRNSCDVMNLLAHEEAEHLTSTCELRLIQCQCGLYVRSKDLNEHCEFQCSERQVSCPQGCGEQISFQQRENHINFHCSKRFLFQFSALVECPNACGLSMLRRELLEHVSSQCEKRLIECPQLCGNTMQLDQLKGSSCIIM
jgi:hypothetical protein